MLCVYIPSVDNFKIEQKFIYLSSFMTNKVKVWREIEMQALQEAIED